jgi:rubrerythrin
MAIVFNADEILGMAEQIERNGAVFYRRAASAHPGAAKLLLEIAHQEDRHRETFEAMRRDLSDDLHQETAYDPDSEAGLYLKALADRRVFILDSVPNGGLNGTESLEEIVAIAIGKEKDSIAFYAGLKSVVPVSLGADRLDAIIAEEVKHIAWLNRAFDETGAA